jgi:hypothetical protein
VIGAPLEPASVALGVPDGAGVVRAGRPASGVLDLFGTEGGVDEAGVVAAGAAASGVLDFFAVVVDPSGAAGLVEVPALAEAAAAAATAEAAAAIATAALA